MPVRLWWKHNGATSRSALHLPSPRSIRCTEKKFRPGNGTFHKTTTGSCLALAKTTSHEGDRQCGQVMLGPAMHVPSYDEPDCALLVSCHGNDEVMVPRKCLSRLPLRAYSLHTTFARGHWRGAGFSYVNLPASETATRLGFLWAGSLPGPVF